MRFDVLGPLRVVSESGPVAVPPGRPAAALCWLVLHLNDPVSLESFGPVLWDRPPDGMVGKARAILRGLERLVGSSYLQLGAQARLSAPEDAVDACRFVAGVESAGRLRADRDVEGARGQLRGALDLWRGMPYVELSRALPSVGVAERLESMRLDAIEDLAALDLHADVDYTVVAELRALVVLHPERMALRRLLALALYRTDRQIESLDVLRAARAELGDIDGGAASLQAAILQHDPRLAMGELPVA